MSTTIKSTPPSPTIEELSAYKVVKVFKYGNHADSVSLLEGPLGKIVKKVYPQNSRSRKFYEREIMMMEHLKKCKFAAKLIAKDDETLTMWITYCGKTPKRTPENLAKIRKGAMKLHQKWGLVRMEDGRPKYDIFIYNTGLLNGKIYFFDFAGEKWQIIKRHIKNKKKTKKPTTNQNQ